MKEQNLKESSAPAIKVNGIVCGATQTQALNTIKAVEIYKNGKEECAKVIFRIFKPIAIKGDIQAFDHFKASIVSKVCHEQGWVDQNGDPIHTSIHALFNKGFKESYPCNVITLIRNACKCEDEELRKEALKNRLHAQKYTDLLNTKKQDETSDKEPTREEVDAKIENPSNDPILSEVKKQVIDIIIYKLNDDQATAISRTLQKIIEEQDKKKVS